MMLQTTLIGAAVLSVMTGCAALAAEGPSANPPRKESATAGSQPSAMPLKVVAGKRGILFGAAVVGRLLADPKSPYAQAVARECSIITPENDMKFHPLRPAPDTWEWSNADTVVKFAEKHGIKVHGHTLVWHEQLPKWVTETKRTPQQVRELMLGHIEAVAGRYRGRIHAWDVVNEALDKDGAFRSTYWKDALGEEYIDLAFRKAHEVDPRALLVYNDFDIEGPGKKADGVYNLVKGMKQRGVPIHAVGFQSHLAVGWIPPFQDMRANIERFRDLGVEVWITELDLRIKVPVTSEELSRQADAYGGLVRTCMETGAVKSIQTWGLDDGHSWVPKFFEGYGDALLLDKDLRPKPAYFAVLNALNNGTGTALSKAFEENVDHLVAGTPDEEINSSFESLRSAGMKAFPALIRHFRDRRAADLRFQGDVRSLDGTAPNPRIGEVCFDILQAQVEGAWPKAYRDYYVLAPDNTEKWLSHHAGMTLTQLQVAAAEESLAKAKRDPALATQPSDYREGVIKFLQERLEKVKP